MKWFHGWKWDEKWLKIVEKVIAVKVDLFEVIKYVMKLKSEKVVEKSVIPIVWTILK